MARIQRLDWRPDRVEHIARHGVTPDEFEEALFSDRGRLLKRVGPGQRDPTETVYRCLGRTEAGRYLFMAMLRYAGEHEASGLALPLTARDMTDSERRRYTR